MSAPHDLKNDYDENERVSTTNERLDADVDAEFGGSAERAKMEKRLLRKLDIRHSILIVIYILNYVGRLQLYVPSPC
jgi:hypothetical protein